LIEPGVIKTNIANDMVIAKKSQNSNSPYSQIIRKMSTSFEHMLENAASSSPDLVAKVVLQAVTSENPSLRYLAGKDVEMWIEVKEICLMMNFIK
jgi:F0F1-type ATP synthase alpha subunit